MLLAVETGMRRSEIAGIQRENLDLVYGTIFLAMTKNGDSRYVPLTPIAKDLLRRFVANKVTRGPVFTIKPEAITRSFIRARQKARRTYEALCQKYGRKPRAEYFIDLRFHDLRHESTSILATVFEMHELAKVTGHKDTRMLLRYYNPHGRELAQKLTRSALGKRQLQKLRQARLMEADHA
jgi:integrase